MAHVLHGAGIFSYKNWVIFRVLVNIPAPWRVGNTTTTKMEMNKVAVGSCTGTKKKRS